MNTQKINLGEALRHIEQSIIIKPGKNFIKNYQNKLFNYISKANKTKLPKGVHAINLDPPTKIKKLLSEIVNIYLETFVAIKKRQMLEANEEAINDGGKATYNEIQLNRVTGKKLLRISPTFRHFLFSELDRIEIYPTFDYEVIIDLIPIQTKTGQIEFGFNLKSDIAKARLNQLFPNEYINEGIKYLPNSAFINLNLKDILERAAGLCEVIAELNFDTEIPDEFRDKKTGGNKTSDERKRINKFLKDLKKRDPKLKNNVERFYKYQQEILNISKIEWEKFLNNVKTKSINSYFKEFPDCSKTEVENYWDGKIEGIPHHHYFKAKEQGILNRFLWTNNREYAKKEFMKLFPNYSESEFNLYHDYYQYFLNEEMIKNAPNSLQNKISEACKDIEKEYKDDFVEAKENGIHYFGKKMKGKGLGYSYFIHLLDTMRRRNP